MKKLNFNYLLSALIIAIGIILHGVIINEPNEVKVVMDISEVSDYLSLTEDEVLKIIELEKSYLIKQGSFHGTMLTYYIVDDEYYFYKDKIDEWVYDASRDDREYNFDKSRLYK